jgi:hypothetical protein
MTLVSFNNSNVVIPFDCVIGMFSCDRNGFLREPHQSDEVTEGHDSIDARWKLIHNRIECGIIRVEISQDSKLHSTGVSPRVVLYVE